eukprot:CAMPEP_0197026238 /NCGR_PEP_ID=MMETSP1384-20130603/6371_1 /TAXON_ID=29189 /ORGANISM="Ammonia sp." /LENGTH=548 /DNA_ID=CAMNT_0042454877 /DNA_START=40 /DNA_END=1686 /DNA_ORIENTATION=+
MQVLSGDDVQNPAIDENQPLLATNTNTANDEEKNNIDTKSFLITCAANLYEYYDFALLGFFSEELANALFPAGPGASAIVSLYAMFAIGFVSRPFGGVVFGYFGDRYGRKSSLRMAMILMSFPTFLTGCIPGYQYIGWWAPLILLLLRILQGLSTGGENSSASIYVYETAPRNKRAFWLSVFGICSSGTLVASLSHVILQNSLTQTQITDWGWRLPFLLGIGLFIFSLWAKNSLKTTETFHRLETSPYIHSNPIKYVCSHNRALLFKFVFASALQHGSTYMIFVFLPSYLSSDVMRGWNDDGWIDSYAYTINCINSLLFLPICVLVGYNVDRVGTMPFLSAGTILVSLGAPFLFYGLSTSQSTFLNWFYQFLLVMSCVPIWGCIYYWYIHALLPDPRTRVTIYGVGYNLGGAVFGGTAVLIATFFVEETGPIDGMILSGIWMSIMAIMSIATIAYVNWHDSDSVEQQVTAGAEIKDRVERVKYYRQHEFTSTFFLNKLDTIKEASSGEDAMEPFTDSDEYNSSDDDERGDGKKEDSEYHRYSSSKVYG